LRLSSLRYHDNFTAKGIGGVTQGGPSEDREARQAEELLAVRMQEEGIDKELAQAGRGGGRGAAGRAGEEERRAKVDPVKGLLDTVAVLMSRQLRSKCENMFQQVRAWKTCHPESPMSCLESIISPPSPDNLDL
jgi:hypothetical protein